MKIQKKPCLNLNKEQLLKTIQEATRSIDPDLASSWDITYRPFHNMLIDAIENDIEKIVSIK